MEWILLISVHLLVMNLRHLLLVSEIRLLPGRKNNKRTSIPENHESLVSTYSNVGGSVKSFPTKDKTRKTVFHKLKQLDNEFPFCQWGVQQYTHSAKSTSTSYFPLHIFLFSDGNKKDTWRTSHYYLHSSESHRAGAHTWNHWSS